MYHEITLATSKEKVASLDKYSLQRIKHFHKRVFEKDLQYISYDNGGRKVHLYEPPTFTIPQIENKILTERMLSHNPRANHLKECFKGPHMWENSSSILPREGHQGQKRPFLASQVIKNDIIMHWRGALG